MTERNQDSERLDALLRCKRYEQPPPGYFASFSDKVISRLEAEETSQYSTWWSWLVARFDAKPVLVCAYTLAVSALLFSGFRVSQAFEAELGAAPRPSGPWLAVTPASIVFPGDLSEVRFHQGRHAASPSLLKVAFRDESRSVPFPASTLHLQSPVGLRH